MRRIERHLTIQSKKIKIDKPVLSGKKSSRYSIFFFFRLVIRIWALWIFSFRNSVHSRGKYRQQRFSPTFPVSYRKKNLTNVNDRQNTSFQKLE